MLRCGCVGSATSKEAHVRGRSLARSDKLPSRLIRLHLSMASKSRFPSSFVGTETESETDIETEVQGNNQTLAQPTSSISPMTFSEGEEAETKPEVVREISLSFA